MILDNKGNFEWDVIIEKTCAQAWAGVCSPEEYSINYEELSSAQSMWVVGSSGYTYHNSDRLKKHPSFGDGTKITFHLDMNKRTCAFTINGTKYPAEWNNLPSKLCPIVVICYPCRIQIQHCRKV
jgi:hypothetical protein